jgi:hypothetical protein
MYSIRMTFKNGFDPLIIKLCQSTDFQRAYKLYDVAVSEAHDDVVRIELKQDRKVLAFATL